MERVEGTRLVVTEVTLLGEILSRRDPDMSYVVDRLATGRLTASERQRVLRAIVNELCELPENDIRRALELEELLIHLGPPEAA